MKPVYFAPMEGIGNHIYRSVFCRHYKGVDRFYTPFIDVSSDGRMKNRGRADILPENNAGVCLVPQILAKDPEAFLAAARQIADFGWREVNLNAGCPSPTVTKKGKGSALLEDPDRLRRFLDRVIPACPAAVSVKTRIGIRDPEEWEEIFSVFNDYPLAELIIHPRLQTEFYRGGIHEECFRQICRKSRVPLCLNPGITEPEAFFRYENSYPELSGIMIGRGLIADPSLAEKIRQISTQKNLSQELAAEKTDVTAEKKEKAGPEGRSSAVSAQEKSAGRKTGREAARFFAFHDDLLEAYRGILYGDTPVLFKMKELWDYWQFTFPPGEERMKELRRAKTLAEYESLVRELKP